MAKAEQPIRVSSEEESPVIRRLEVELDASLVRRAYDRAYRELARHAQVRGFRPGKAPRSVLEKLYGSSVAEQIERTLVADSIGDAIEQSGVEPVTEPAIESSPPQRGEAFRYVARVEVRPAIELGDTEGLPARRPRVEVGEEQVERELESLRQAQAPVVELPEGSAAALGHVLVIDYAGRVDDEAFEGGSGKGVELELGSGRFLPGFEDQLVGAVAGEDREVRARFPDEYGRSDLAGQEAVFTVHVEAVKERRVPELDDEFAKDLGEFDSLEALRTRIRDELTASQERAAKSAMRESLVDSLIERTPFEVPAGLIERQLARQLTSARQRLEGSVPDAALGAQLERWKEEWRGRAEREVREMLLLDAVARSEGLDVSDEEVEARIDEIAQERGGTPAQLRRAMGEDALASALRAQLLEEKALDFLGSRAKVEETTDS